MFRTSPQERLEDHAASLTAPGSQGSTTLPACPSMSPLFPDFLCQPAPGEVPSSVTLATTTAHPWSPSLQPLLLQFLSTRFWLDQLQTDISVSTRLKTCKCVSSQSSFPNGGPGHPSSCRMLMICLGKKALCSSYIGNDGQSNTKQASNAAGLPRAPAGRGDCDTPQKGRSSPAHLENHLPFSFVEMVFCGTQCGEG